VFPGKTVCMKCEKHPATVKLTRIVNGEASVLHLCQECAAEISPYQKSMQMNLSQLLASILQGGKEKTEEEQPAEAVLKMQCGTCGQSFQRYKKTLFLGCPDCYVSFGKPMVAELRKFHGSTQHRGKVPARQRWVIERRRTIEELRQRMNQAIEREEFETAAKLRDEIRQLTENTPSAEDSVDSQ
jgi:protein arginine kinase activator